MDLKLISLLILIPLNGLSIHSKICNSEVTKRV